MTLQLPSLVAAQGGTLNCDQDYSERKAVLASFRASAPMHLAQLLKWGEV